MNINISHDDAKLLWDVFVTWMDNQQRTTETPKEWQAKLKQMERIDVALDEAIKEGE